MLPISLLFPFSFPRPNTRLSSRSNPQTETPLGEPCSAIPCLLANPPAPSGSVFFRRSIRNVQILVVFRAVGGTRECFRFGSLTADGGFIGV